MRLARRRSVTTVLAVLMLGSSVIPATAAVSTPRTVLGQTAAALQGTPAETAPAADAAGLRTSIHWEEAQAHAKDKLDLPAGGRVTVPFRPRADDHWKVGGIAPRALPEGRLTGRQLRDALRPKPVAQPKPAEPATEVAPAADPTATPTDAPADPTAEPSEEPAVESSPEPAADPSPEPSATDTPVDQPVVDPSDVIAAESASWSSTDETSTEASVFQPAAVIKPAGLRREVFGFLPYWELSDSSTTLDFSTISTIAYFGVGASATGTFEDTAGWTGWTSSAMTNVINKAHQNHTRVVLTVQSFAWSSGGSTKQKALLGSATNRARLAINVAKQIRDRGADGVNLDFEPLAAGYADEFVLLVKRVRTELDNVAKGYQLTFDTLGYIGNYPIEEATAAGAADAIFVMGYDYRSAGSSPVGSIAPIGGPTYDIVETVNAYRARVPASKLILGVPYYGRAWSTNSDQLHASNTSGTKFGTSNTVIYATGIEVLQEHGRRFDTVDGVAWTAYQRENCSATYGCVTSWRQLYMDDARALKLKYDIVNNYDLRGAGIWALGYDNARPELYAALKDKFVSKIPFTDVNEFVVAIEWLYTSGITSGCSPTLFCPNGRVTRAQMAMFLDRALDLPNTTTNYFDDDNGKTGEAQHQCAGAVRHHRRLRPASLLPERLRDPRPDGDVPRSRARPAEHDHQLLRRRQRQDRRGQHQCAGAVRHHRRLRPAPLLPGVVGDP